MPLALTQAGFYIKRCQVDVNQYIQQFSKNRKLLWNKERRPLNYPWSVRMTWEMSLKRLNSICPAAVHILNSLCYLNDNVPFIYARVMVSDTLAFDEAMEALTSYSLISVNRDKKTISIHPLFRYVLLDSQCESIHSVSFDVAFGSIQKVFQILISDKKDPPNDMDSFLNVTVLDTLFDQFDAAVSYKEKLADSDKLKLAELYKAVAKEVIPISLPAFHGYAVLQGAKLCQGFKNETMESRTVRYYEQAIEIYIKIKGKNCIEIAAILRRMAKVYMDCREYDKSYEILIRALNIYKQSANSYLKQAKIYHQLCILYDLQEDLPQGMEKSIAMSDLGLAVCKEAPEGQDKDLRLFDLLRSRGLVFVHNKHYEDAIKSYEDALKIYCKYPVDLKGQEGDLLNKIADVYYDKKEYAVAADHYERAIIAFDHDGIKNERVYLTLSNLIKLYKILNDYKKLKIALQRAISHRSGMFSGDFLISDMATSLGDLYYSEQEYSKAIENYKIALHHDTVFYGEDSHELIILTHKISLCYYHLEDDEKGDFYTQQVFTIDSGNSCGKCITIAIHHENYGNSLHERKRYDEAVFQFNMAISAYEKCDHQEKDKYYKKSLKNAAIKCFDLNRIEEAIEFYKKLISVDSTSTYYHNLACCYRIKGDYKTARKHFKKSLKLQRRACTYADYGLLLMKNNQTPKALKLFIKAIELGDDGSGLIYAQNERLFLDEHLQQEITATKSFRIKAVIIAHYWLIQSYQQVNDKENTKLYFDKLKTLAKEQPSAKTNRLISYIYRSVDKENRADKYLRRATSIKDSKNRTTVFSPAFFKPENSATRAAPSEVDKKIKEEPTAKIKNHTRHSLTDNQYRY